MDRWKDDVVFALRSLTRSPGVMLAAVVCLALGVGATTTVYSATRALVLHPVPVPKGSRVVRVTEMPPQARRDFNGVAPATFLEWQRELRSYTQIAGIDWSAVNLTGTTEPERVSSAYVTPGFFTILKQAPLLGRALIEADIQPGRDQVVVLSHALWQRRFASQSDVIGQRVAINGQTHEIVGVMPVEFVFPPGAELWLPLSIAGTAASDRMGNNYVDVIATLKPGITVDQASAEVAAHERTVTERFPLERQSWSALAEPVQHYYGADPRPYLRVAFLAVLLVLLIGCANVANLLLARATGRMRELAVRTALGASRGDIVRLLLTESALLALVAGVAGVLIALWGVLLFRNSIPAELVKFNPGWTSIRVDAPTLAFALIIALGSSLVFGVLPALQAARTSVQGELRENAPGSRRRNRTRNALVVLEIALALMLVVSTGLLLRSFKSLLDADGGFRRERILTMQIALPTDRYETPMRRSDFYLRLEESLHALNGVESVGLVNILPMDWSDIATRVTDDVRPALAEGEMPIVRSRTVSDRYFQALDIPVIRGRNFDSQDHRESTPAVIVSDRLARQLWAGSDPLRHRLRQVGDTIWWQVIGVVADTRHNPNVGDPIQPTVHFAARQRGPVAMSIVLRTTGEPSTVATDAQRAIAQLDPTLAAGDVRSLERVIHNALAPQRSSAGMLGVFGLVALILACLGVYGVMSYSVARRASELGVRVALGARQSDMLGLIMHQGARLTTAGTLLGLGGAWALARAMQGLMHDAARPSLLTIAAGTLVLVTTALLACYLPARRAAATDPTSLLRRE
ncbi:MAG: ABC transporter permease [Longimicrobiales bacterium]